EQQCQCDHDEAERGDQPTVHVPALVSTLPYDAVLLLRFRVATQRFQATPRRLARRSRHRRTPEICERFFVLAERSVREPEDFPNLLELPGRNAIERPRLLRVAGCVSEPPFVERLLRAQHELA